MDRHYSPYYIQALDIKAENQYELISAVDLISSVLNAFADSQLMAAHNLWNLYIGEDLREILPLCIVNTTFTQLFTLPKSSHPAVFYSSLLLQLISQTKDSSLFKGFPGLVEDAMAFLLAKSAQMDSEIYQRLMDCVCFYVSQHDFKGDSLLKKMEDIEVEEQVFKQMMAQLIRMSFFKKLQTSTDASFHKYLPEDAQANELVFEYLGTNDNPKNPDASAIMEKMNAKETPANLRTFMTESLQAKG